MKKQDGYLNQFVSSFGKNINTMAGLNCEYDKPRRQSSTFRSNGLTVIIGITGARPGIIIVDTGRELARRLCELINGEEYSTDDEFVLYTIAEFANVFSGHAVSLLNDSNGLQLDLTPPSILFGDKVVITSPKIKPEVIEIKTPLGEISITVGFERSL
ncbi:MAG: chemotaxis protein CheX [Bacillota bacterium]